MDPNLIRDGDETSAALGALNEHFSGKTVLLTGAAGFLGCQFVHYFLRLNDSGRLTAPCRLLAWDSYLRGCPAWLKGLEGRSDLVLEKRDITHSSPAGGHDFVIHAASIASPIFYRQHPLATMDANVVGLRHLLEAARETPVESFLFFSSSEIYGNPEPGSIPTPETYNGNVSCTGPRACYDESKRYGETLCVNFWREFQTPVKVARPFNNYGPGLKISDRRVLPDFFRDVLASRNVVLLSDGLATRTFCYTSDALTGYLRLLLSTENGEAFNIGTEAPEISMRDLAALVIRVAGKPLRVEFQSSADRDYTTDNPQRRCPNIEKARTRLGYHPQITLEEGLQRTYQYYLDNPSAEDA